MSVPEKGVLDFGRIREVWKEYVTQKDTEYKLPGEVIRPEIFESWKRCAQQGVNPFLKTNTLLLTAAELNRRRQEYAEVLAIAEPIIQKLYSFVKGSGFLVALADSEGYLLKIVGDSWAKDFAKLSNFMEGSNWSEKVMGTNGVGTPLVTGEPIQVYGAEHYCLCAHNATCSGAPLFSPEGLAMGVLDMTGKSDEVHPHTLGMVIAAADAITNEIRVRRLDQNKQAIIESMSEGVLVLNEKGIITHINATAARILQLNQERMVGRLLEELVCKTSPTSTANLRLIEMIRSGKAVTDELIDIRTRVGVIQCSLTFRPLLVLGKRVGTVIVVAERKRVNRLLRKAIGITPCFTFQNIIGKSSKFREALELAKTAADIDSTILLTGESGTGKDVLAQAIHNKSSRSPYPFVAINCGAIPRELLASELFGYEEGAFTGARRGGNIGKFELADGGTLFLDEIGEMSLEMQVVLLRAIEEKAITRIGGKETIPINVRIIAATNKDLAQEVASGRFRIDLYYRLNVISIHLPPLRERKDDIKLFAQHFATQIGAKRGTKKIEIQPEALKALEAYNWPGNIRELQNVIERALNVAKDGVITLSCLPDNIRIAAFTPGFWQPWEKTTFPLRLLEMRAIQEALEKCNGNQTQAAKLLGIHRSTLYRRLNRK